MRPIQTTLLFVAAGSALGLYWLPIASTTEAAALSHLFQDQKYTISDKTLLPIAFTLSAILCLVGIFMHHNRKLQIFLAFAALIAHLAGGILAYLYYAQDKKGLEEIIPTWGAGALIPVLFTVLVGFAIRYIRKDERLVRSMNRMR